jgi:hypothetical protein
MLDGVMLLWFILTALSLLFVVVDIRSTPASPVLNWGFILLTAYTGPLHFSVWPVCDMAESLSDTERHDIH